MKRWILPVVCVLIAAAIAWPFIFGGGTVEVKGRTFVVEHRLGEDGTNSRYTALHNRAALDKEHAILCSWDRDRYLYSWSDGSRFGFDVAYLDEAGKVLQIGRVRPGRVELDEEGVASTVEARRALYLPEGTIESLSLAAGDSVSLSGDLASAKPEPMTTIKVGDKTVRVELSSSYMQRSRGLMHRQKMSKDEGMLFLYQKEKTSPNLSFYMRNTYMSLDISYFNNAGHLVNVVSAERADDPALRGAGITAPANGPAQYVLEVPIGWFRENGLTDDKGKPVKPVSVELPDYVKKRTEKADPSQ